MEQIQVGTCPPHSRVPSSEYNPRKASQTYRHTTHRTWFKRNIEGAPLEPPVLELLARLPNDHHLSVCGWIMSCFDKVMPFGQDYPCSNNHSANGYLTSSSCCTGQFERASHELGIGCRISHSSSNAAGGKLETGPKRFELLTFWFVARRSIQLS
jgi:hypothetical protein